jgi:SAM-dependent methyltransferase
MPQNFIVARVVETVKRLPGFPNLSVIDLSCGEGEIISKLRHLGCTVRGSRYKAGDYIIKSEQTDESFEIDEKIDLVKPLPYSSNQFDVVILTEVVEHLDTYSSVVREAGRILKPGGTLILTTPNIHRMHSRWSFFFSGAHKLINRRIGWDIPADGLYAYHICPVDLPYLHTLLYLSQLRIEALLMTRFKFRHALWLLLYPLVLVGGMLQFRKGKQGSLRAEGEHDLRKWMTSFPLFYSDQLFIVAGKTMTDPS